MHQRHRDEPDGALPLPLAGEDEPAGLLPDLEPGLLSLHPLKESIAAAVIPNARSAATRTGVRAGRTVVVRVGMRKSLQCLGEQKAPPGYSTFWPGFFRAGTANIGIIASPIHNRASTPAAMTGPVSWVVVKIASMFMLRIVRPVAMSMRQAIGSEGNSPAG